MQFIKNENMFDNIVGYQILRAETKYFIDSTAAGIGYISFNAMAAI